MRRCLRSSKKALRCASKTAAPRTRCVATAICPARSVATSTSSIPPPLPLPKTRRLPTTLHAQAQPSSSLLRRRGYNSSSPPPSPAPPTSQPGTAASDPPGAEREAARVLQQAPTHLNDKERQIWEMLMRELQCTSLEVQDISGGCGSMYGIDVVSERFRGLGMLKQQRLVNEVLGEEIKGWHGVQLKTRAP
ncbi:BolA-like protein [Drepanopeziza brunnea f. sp. 'multigermtubi' MB_m1]|uniref:BolA-like protein n=2 Tax=Drepanopeziza brunnea f. sp. 'multigermtubi' TaxID=698441 RepID=K1WU85_MARBU|nr:BolA-like protein [Drepanopeziza brunnea f. sp. 'multigermtubi' MB_m1]EKD21210.1 BolA-like protein [Drepanopeziza brunnea f. sp. 'multigermtubi' MB_m1]